MEPQQKKNPYEIAASISLLVVSVFLVLVFASYYQLKYTLISDLVPESAPYIIFESYARQGLLLSFGLILSAGFRIAKKYQIAIFVDGISIALFSALS